MKFESRSVADLHITFNKKGDFYCTGNQLTSLEGSPSTVNGSFYCGFNKLTSLEGAPSSVGGNFYCINNQLTSLTGAPFSVGFSFSCANNQLTSLEGSPSTVGDNFYCANNQLTSLEDIHKQLKQIKGIFYCGNNKLKSHVLGLLLINEIARVDLDNKQVQDILNKHLPSRGIRDVLEAQDELIEAGLEEFAQL